MSKFRNIKQLPFKAFYEKAGEIRKKKVEEKKKKGYVSVVPRCPNCNSKRPGPWCTCEPVPRELLYHDFIYYEDLEEDAYGWLVTPQVAALSRALRKPEPCTTTPETILTEGVSQLLLETSPRSSCC